MSPVSQRRVGIAFGLTPFVCAVLGFVLFPPLAWTHAGRTVDVFESAIASGVLTGIIGGMITGAIAHPTFERLMKRGPVTATRTILFGALFGNIPAIIAIVGTVLVRRDMGALSDAVSGSWRAIAFGTAVGALSSAVFWSVAGPQIASTQSRGIVRDLTNKQIFLLPENLLGRFVFELAIPMAMAAWALWVILTERRQPTSSSFGLATDP